jgi:hypothetical protein
MVFQNRYPIRAVAPNCVAIESDHVAAAGCERVEGRRSVSVSERLERFTRAVYPVTGRHDPSKRVEAPHCM